MCVQCHVTAGTHPAFTRSPHVARWPSARPLDDGLQEATCRSRLQHDTLASPSARTRIAYDDWSRIFQGKQSHIAVRSLFVIVPAIAAARRI